jgi:LemA protein
MAKGIVIIVLLVAIALVAVSWYISGLNRVVRLDEAVNAAWAQVDNQLQRRNDLIPNLVATVKGYASHEEGLFTEVTRLRSQWAQAATREQRIEAAQGLEGVISRLLLVAENYPELKANENFLTLQAQLEGTENRIATERMRYNEAVRTFNAHIRTVLGSFFAARRGLSEAAPYFEAEEGATAVPRVEF